MLNNELHDGCTSLSGYKSIFLLVLCLHGTCISQSCPLFNYHKLIDAQDLQAPGLNQIAGATMGHRTIPQAYIHTAYRNTTEMLLDHSVNPLGKCNTIMYHRSLVATLICVRIAPALCVSMNHPNCVKTNKPRTLNTEEYYC